MTEMIGLVLTHSASLGFRALSVAQGNHPSTHPPAVPAALKEDISIASPGEMHHNRYDCRQLGFADADQLKYQQRTSRSLGRPFAPPPSELKQHQEARG
jgi:hypothetical protein